MKLISFTLFFSMAITTYATASSNLKVNFSKAPAVIIPSPSSTLSCGQMVTGKLNQYGDIAGGYFTFPVPEMTWTGDPQFSDVRINALVLKLNTRHTGEYKCIYSGTNLGLMHYQMYAVGDDVLARTWDQNLGRRSSDGVVSTAHLVGKYSVCDLKCGSLNMAKSVPKFTAHGVWEVHGVSRKYDPVDTTKYKEYPVKVKGKFTVKNVIN